MWVGRELSSRIGPAGGKLRIRSGFEPNWCGASSTQRLEEIMKRTRKSEAAETKVRILRLGSGSWGEERRSQKASRAKGECSGGGFSEWAKREFSAEVNGGPHSPGT